jgi:hypothetical protein
MSPSIDAVASHACIASKSPAIRQQKRVDFLTQYCGLSLPTLFKRIGIMAADGQSHRTRFDAARRRRLGRPELAWQTGNPSLGPHVQAGLPVKTPPTIIASGPADGQAAALPMRGGKGFGGPIKPASTTPTVVAFGHAYAPSQARLDNRKRMVVAKPSSWPIAIHPPRRQRMSARAGPFS